MAVLRTHAALHAASDQDLRDTYVAMTGEAPPPTALALRDAMITAVGMALMAASDAAGHLGVPKGSAPPRPMTKHELLLAAPGAHSEAPSLTPRAASPHQEPLIMATSKKNPAPPPPPATRGRTPLTTVFKLAPAGSGTTNVRPASRRGQIMAFLAEQPGKKASIEAVATAIGASPLGDLRELQKLGHLVEA